MCVVQKVDAWTMHGQIPTSVLAEGFVCKRYAMMTRNKTYVERSNYDIKTVEVFCYLENALNTRDGSEMTVAARTTIGWMRLRECREVFVWKKVFVKDEKKRYQICLRSAILKGSETWCLRKREVELLKRTERAMLRAMSGVKLIDQKSTTELMQMFGVTVLIERISRASATKSYKNVLRREESNVPKEALNFEVTGRRKMGKLKAT